MQLLERISQKFGIFWLVLNPSQSSLYMYFCLCVLRIPIANLPLAFYFLPRITSRSSFPQWEDNWRQRVRGSPTARVAVEGRPGAVALLDSMALTNTISRALALELGVQVVLGAKLAEEELLVQQGLESQEQASILTRNSTSGP